MYILRYNTYEKSFSYIVWDSFMYFFQILEIFCSKKIFGKKWSKECREISTDLLFNENKNHY